MSNFPGAAFDRWLTTDPRDAEQEAFERFCEAEGIDYDDPTAVDRFERAMWDAGEDAADARAEAARERDW